MAKIYGSTIYRGNDKIGWGEGTTLCDESGNSVGYWESGNIYKASGEKIGYIEGDYIYYADGSEFSTIEKARYQIEEGDCSNEFCAAVALLFGY
jgi:hypothetical protein